MKWVLVTGGAKGLGATICLELAKAGYAIAIHYRSSKKAAEELASQCVKAGVEAEIIEGDLSNFATLKKFMEEYKERFFQTKAIIHNVGAYFVQPFLETSLEDLDYLFKANFFAPFYITREMQKSLIDSQGSVIHIGQTGVGKGRVKKGAPAYFLSKQALYHLTQSFAFELAPYNVRVNMVSPGILENSKDGDEYFIPMHRRGLLQEVASFVVFLLDEKNNYITGQNIEIAGGFGL